MPNDRLLVDEILRGAGDLAPEEERKWRICKAYDCTKLLPEGCPKNRRFCDHKCARRHKALREYKSPVVRRCKECYKATFIPKPNQVYCSQKCILKSAARRNKAWREANPEKHRKKNADYQRHLRAAKRRRRKIPETLSCRQCGEAFTPLRVNHYLCSRPCSIAYYNAKRRAKLEVKKPCGWCSAFFTQQTSRHTYCSYKCYNAALCHERKEKRKANARE